MPVALRAALVALPAVLIALAGLAHPVFLTPETADRWRLVHLVLLPAFPLLAGSVLYLLRADRGPLAWVARVAAFAYAVLYGALDAIAGIGAPAQVAERGRSAPIGDLFRAGDQLGHLGVLALALALVLTAVVLWQRSGSSLALLGGALGAASCWWFYRDHVFAPRGVLALLCIGVGLVLLALSDARKVAQAPS